MKFTRFEQLVLGVGGAAILGSVALSLPSAVPETVEILAQVMLFLVLFAAVRYGRKGGLVAALGASIAYAVMRIPMLAVPEIPAAVVLMLVSRLAAFGLVGVVGGEAFMRLKYAFARLEGRSALDDWSRVYNQNYMCNALVQARSRFTRYSEQVSVITVTIAPAVTADLSPARQRSVARGVAEHIRSDIRMVDEVGRLDDGRFLVLLPHTPKAGASVVLERLRSGVTKSLGARDESVTLKCVALPEDESAFSALLESLAPCEDPQTSGEYSSSADMQRKPADVSASSAPASSTLNTSTAASPDGSTKQ